MKNWQSVDWFLKSPRKKRKIADSDLLLPYFWKQTTPEPSDDMKRLWHKVPSLHFKPRELENFVASLDQNIAEISRLGRGRIFYWDLTEAKNTTRSRPHKTEVVHATKNCFGYAKEILLHLGLEGYFASGARILAVAPGTEMKFQRAEFDPFQPQAYQLRIPIIAPAETKLEWRIGDKVKGIHLPANGRAYLINASEPHRMVNRSKTKISYDFICSLNLY